MTTILKPSRACDVRLDKLSYPVLIMPKIDGVRACIPDGQLRSRSGKKFKSLINNDFYTRTSFTGFDGEMYVESTTTENLCSKTTGALGRIKGEEHTKYALFDYVVPATKTVPYIERLKSLEIVIETLLNGLPKLKEFLSIVSYQLVNTEEELLAQEAIWLEEGYEGVILRDPQGLYKEGRCTVREGSYLRLKRFMDSEIRVTRVLEGTTNNNPAKKTIHGKTERATCKENMAPNGRIGTIIGTAIEDIVFNDRVLVEKGCEVEISPGKMTHAEREHLLINQDEILGKLVKFQFFPIGIKDKLRFTTFQCFRAEEDMAV